MPPSSLRRLPLLSMLFGAGLFLFHLLTNRQYGIHGDEFYFVVCGDRPAWGYVDHPPLVPLLARLATALFGVSMFSLRLFPALALGLSCALTGWLARRLGAGRYGEFLACLSFCCAPLLLRLGALLNIPAFEVFFWLLTAHLLASLCRQHDARWWVAVGAVAGVALLNKHTTLFLGTGLAVGLLFTPRRNDLLSPWPWVGGILAFLIFLPNLLWQYQHEWATLEFVQNLNREVMSDTSRVDFVLAQLVLMNLFNAVVWIAGLWFFLRTASGRPYRIHGWIFISTLVIMLALGAKVYYMVAAYPMILAGGAVLLEQKLGRSLRVLLPAAIAVMGMIFLPIVTPVGTLEGKERYISRVLGFMIDNPLDLTFDFHYQLGRPEQVETFSRVFESLPAQEKQDCVILTHEYDTASNLNVRGTAKGLPPAISGSNSYYLWGPQGATGNCVIAFGYEESLLQECFGEVTIAATLPNLLAETGAPPRPIYVCRKPVAALDALWPKFKRYR